MQRHVALRLRTAASTPIRLYTNRHCTGYVLINYGTTHIRLCSVQAPVVHSMKKLEGQALSCPIILNEMESDGRKHPTHQSAYERHNTPVIVFLTVCTKDRKAIIANDSAHHLLRAAWQTQPSWLVGRYVILPDHLHLFCAPAELIGTTHIRLRSVQAPVVPPIDNSIE